MDHIWLMLYDAKDSNGYKTSELISSLSRKCKWDEICLIFEKQKKLSDGNWV